MTPLAPDARPLRVLVVDDDEDSAYLASEMLKGRGHEVEMTLGGITALSRVRVFDPDLVLLDLVMPGLNGIVVGREIRQMSLPKDPSLVAYSGLITPQVRLDCIEAGFDHFLPKPAGLVELDQLVELVTEIEKPDRFQQLARNYETAVYAFLWSQLDFYDLVLESMSERREPAVLRRQLNSTFRLIDRAEGWLERQTATPLKSKLLLQERLARMRVRLAGIKSR